MSSADNPHYQECPFCGGTGRRVVVDLPEKRRHGRPRGGGNPQHGTNAMYVTNGCRCELCTAAHRQWNQRERALKSDEP